MRKGFNSRLREEATDGLAKMDALLNVSTHASVRRLKLVLNFAHPENVSTHASVRRRPGHEHGVRVGGEFQLTPP